MSTRPNSSVTPPEIDEGDFHEGIQRAITEKRHVGYLRGVLKDYAAYQRYFDGVFTNQQPLDSMYQFRVTYQLKPKTWREIEILGLQTLNDLAMGIVHSMDWQNDHMHGFSFPRLDRKQRELVYGISPFVIFAPGWEMDPHPVYESDHVLIAQVDYAKFPKIGFLFDFGDGHQFTIEYKGTRPALKRELARNGQGLFPQLIDQRGVAAFQYPDWERGVLKHFGIPLAEE